MNDPPYESITHKTPRTIAAFPNTTANSDVNYLLYIRKEGENARNVETIFGKALSNTFVLYLLSIIP